MVKAPTDKRATLIIHEALYAWDRGSEIDQQLQRSLVGIDRHQGPKPYGGSFTALTSINTLGADVDVALFGTAPAFAMAELRQPTIYYVDDVRRTATRLLLAQFPARQFFVPFELESEDIDQKLEGLYQDLGDWRKPRDHGAMAFEWAQLGEIGASWLVERISREEDPEALLDASWVLSRMGEAGLAAAIGKLAEGLAADHAKALLSAMEGPRLPQGFTLALRLEEVLSRYSRHDDIDVREAAYEATRCLPESRAIKFLKEAIVDEPDPDLRATILGILPTSARG